MTYIGLATSICMHIEIPIVLRSLASSFTSMPKAKSPAKFDLDFLALLEAGAKYNEPGYVVDLYTQAWWEKNGFNRRSGPLTEDTIESAIALHRKQLKKAKAAFQSNSNSNSNNDQISTTPSSSDTPFDENILLNTLCNAEAMANGLNILTQAEHQVAIRRAKAFYMLHEASIVLDVTDQSGGESNTKWITGQDLTLDQVFGICNASEDLPHDGYVHDLPSGVLSGEYSTEETLSSQEHLDSISPSGSESPSVHDAPPETDLQLPSYFDPYHNHIVAWETELPEVSEFLYSQRLQY